MNENVKIIRIPTMKTITEVVNETGLSYRLLLSWCKENKVAHVKAGKKFLINCEKLAEYLNTGDVEFEN